MTLTMATGTLLCICIWKAKLIYQPFIYKFKYIKVLFLEPYLFIDLVIVLLSICIYINMIIFFVSLTILNINNLKNIEY